MYRQVGRRVVALKTYVRPHRVHLALNKKGSGLLIGTLVGLGAMGMWYMYEEYEKRNEKKYFKISLDDAIYSKYSSAVKYCLKDKESLNELDERGNNKLHIATKGKNFEIVKLLIEAGIDVNHKNKYGYSAISYVIGHLSSWKKSERKELLKLFIKHGANISLLDAIKSGYAFVVKHALKQGKEFGKLDDCFDNTKSNLVWNRCEIVEISKLLIEAGINVNHQNGDGDTFLHFVVNTYGDIEKEDRRKLIELLLHHKADVNIRNNEGETPLFILVKSIDKLGYIIDWSEYRYRKLILKMLLENGANPLIKNNNGKFVSSWRHKDIQELLEEAVEKLFR